MMHENEVVNDVALSAVNYGEHYAKHRELAERNASQGEWINHVSNTILHTWYHNGGTRRVTMAHRYAIAMCLREYYAAHVLES